MAIQKYYADIDLNQNELQNAVIQNLAAAPATPKAGQTYFNTALSLLYVYDGSAWVNALAQGQAYTFSTGLTESSGTVTLNQATTSTLGGVIVGTNLSVNSGTISVADASTSAKGVIEIATDAEVETGTSETLAVNPKQLATKITNGGVYSADEDNYVGSLLDLSFYTQTNSDSGDSEFVFDASEYGDINIFATDFFFNNEAVLTQADVTSTYDPSDTAPVNGVAVSSAITSALVGGMVYKGVWTATGQTDYSSITLPVKAGYMYLVSGTATIGGIEWNTDDYLVINADVAVGGTITDVKKIDNTEGSDIVRLNASQTLTNKTIDADDNTISDLTTSNLKSGVLQTTVRAVASASDTAIPSEKAVASALASRVITANNTALTASGGVCTWSVTNSTSSTSLVVQVVEISTNKVVGCEIAITTSAITIKFNSASNIAANTFRLVAIG